MYHRPLWMTTSPRLGVEPFASLKMRVFNRSGAASVVGGNYAFDVGQTLAAGTVNSKGVIPPAVTTFEWGSDSSIFRQVIITPATGATNNPMLTGIFGIAQQAVADMEEFDLIVMGVCSINIQPLVASTVHKTWNQLQPTSAVTTVEIKANGAGTTKGIGYNLAPVTSGVSVPPIAVIPLVRCLFSGFGLAR